MTPCRITWVVMALCLCHGVLSLDLDLNAANRRESRKLFGGYRITPRFCKPSRKSTSSLGGPSICMFNHECSQRNGQVVGACMDGFLFGACCQLPAGASGELIESDIVPVTSVDNYIASPSLPSDIMSNGVSQIAQSLLSPGILPTAQDNAVVQLSGDHTAFTTTGVTQNQEADTVLVDGATHIRPSDFQVGVVEDRTTMRFEQSTVPYSDTPMIHVSISTPPGYSTTARPMFRPKPNSDGDKYVLVPTIDHPVRPKPSEQETIVNILQLINDTSTTRKPPSTSYVFSSTSTRRPTTKKAPSTSYVFSSTLKPRRTTTPSTTTTRKRKPTKKTTTKARPGTTIRPVGHSTIANSPLAFVTTIKPPSTSYLYSVVPSRRPAPSTVNTHVAGPGFAVTSTPGQYSSYASPAPTLIVLSPLPDDEEVTNAPETLSNEPPNKYPRPTNNRKPVNSVTINNHVTQNIYSTSERPQPTVLITPKPSISSSSAPLDLSTAAIEVETSGDELSNFPPVRNPNLNMSNPVVGEDDITTPAFVEDDALNDKVESFVNKIIQGLQEPFEGLKDVVYNGSTSTTTTTKKPIKKTTTTTKRPTTRRSTTTRRPSASTAGSRRPTTTKKPKTTRKPITTTTESFIEDNVVVDNDDYRNQCGIRPLLKSGRIVGGKGATFGEFPWQVLVRESTWLGLFTKNKCGGVLISEKYVMTAAHCQPGFLASLVAVFGEFDISGELESRRPISRNVKRVIVHRKYDAATFENDLALLELEAPIKFDQHIIPICLPQEGEDFTGRMATVTGWGRLKYGGGVPSVLQEVQVPIMENHVCQEMFRTAGHSKVILDSFLCAGYANGQKDSCEGDSGGPLVLQRADSRYELAGTVSHGIKCAAPYLPGVYMRTQFYKPWIMAITGIDSSS